jgi:hypothetical protein
VTSDPLTIYLQDHHAGARFGGELARRSAGANEGTEYGEFLARLANEIEEDRRSLEAIMERCDVGTDRLKDAGAWTMEKLGRLKLNGHLFDYAPLSRVLELEGLMGGVRGKLALWHALIELCPADERLDAAELEGLARQAEAQLAGLREQHARAAREALVTS